MFVFVFLSFFLSFFFFFFLGGGGGVVVSINFEINNKEIKFCRLSARQLKVNDIDDPDSRKRLSEDRKQVNKVTKNDIMEHNKICPCHEVWA